VPQIIVKVKEGACGKYFIYIGPGYGPLWHFGGNRSFPLTGFSASGFHSLYNHLKKNKARWVPISNDEEEDRFLLMSKVPDVIFEKVVLNVKQLKDNNTRA